MKFATTQVLLLQPWVEDFYTTDCRIQPIGLAYLAGSLLRRFPDLDVEIYDTLAGGEKRSIPWPREFGYLKDFYGHPDSGPFSLFHQYFRFGQGDDAILERLRGYTPLLVGISSLFTPYYRQSLALAQLCRRTFPGVPIVMGGSHASLSPATLLEPRAATGETLCDFVLRGECEESIVELVEYLQGRRPLAEVSNLVSRETRQPSDSELVTPRREMIPEPEFRGLDARDYTYDRKPMTFLIASRSCPHRCSFCSIHAVFGLRYETRDVDGIVEEILRRYREGIRHFDIEDDNFTFSTEKTHELLDRIIELNLPVTFSAMNGISYISLDDSLLEKMRRAGFASLNLALVSSDQVVLEFTRRPHTVERFLRVVAKANELNLRVTAYFILGMPGQTVGEMWGTLKILGATQCLVGASPFYFTPGSPIHRKEAGNPTIRLASADRDPYFSARLTAMDLESNDFDREDVYTCFRMTRVFNYVKRGIDLGLDRDDEYFEPAWRVFRQRRWFAESKNGQPPLPFSSKVAELLEVDLRDGEPPVIRGYRTGAEVEVASKLLLSSSSSRRTGRRRHEGPVEGRLL